MKKLIVCLLFVSCLFLCLAGCAASPAPATEPSRTETLTASVPITTAAPVTTTEAPATTSAAPTSETNGEPDFDVSAVNGYLDDFFPGVQALVSGSSFTYSWYKGNLFIEIYIPDFDYFYEHKDELDSEDRASIRTMSHGYVIGDFANPVYHNIRSLGGDNFNVYFILLGKNENYCTSCNLRMLSDPLND